MAGWKPGQSGNPLGKALYKPFKYALMVDLLRDGPDMPRLQNIVQAVLRKAENGDIEAVKFVADRLDGRAIQQIDAVINDERSLDTLSTDDLKRRAEELSRRLARRISAPLTATAIEVKSEADE